MLQVAKIKKAFGAESVLEEISFIVNAGDRVGLIGPNGCGKSTLLRIIAGAEKADSGSVAIAPQTRIGYMAQGLDFAGALTVGSAVWGEQYALIRDEMHEIEAHMAEAKNGTMAALMEKYTEVSERFEGLGGYDLEWRAETMLGHLGLHEMALDTPVGQLSGGQQTRLGLARILLAEPSLLLLDEPTNHLDLEALEWLEGFLASYRGAVLMVSHDRTFLDATVNRIVAFDEDKKTVKDYVGNYSDYADQYEHEVGLQWEAYRDQQAEIKRIQQDIAQTREHANSVERSTTPREPGVRRYAKKVAKKAASREKKLDRYIESDERVDKPQSSYKMKLDFGEMPRGGQDVITITGLGHGYGDEWLFRDASLSLRHGERIAVLGVNGSGKSTLLKCIMGELEAKEGAVRIGANVRIGYMPQGQDGLNPNDTPLSVILKARSMSETEARNLLHFFLFGGDDVFVPVRALSYGQRARLILASIVVAGANCLILDEPLNHLDIASRERFEEALDAFPGTILVTGHDRAFIDAIATGIWSVEDGQVRTYVDRDEMTRVRG